LEDLRELNIGSNQIRDLDPIRALRSIEELVVYRNPIHSFRVLEELPRLRELTISPEQAPRFVECRRLEKVRRLRIDGDGEITNFESFPEMPSLRVLRADSKGLSGIDKFPMLENLVVFEGDFSSVDCLQSFRSLTHLSISTSRPLDLRPLASLHNLRRLYVRSSKIENLRELMSLPALHEVEVHPHTTYSAGDLRALRRVLTSWGADFTDASRTISPSLEIETVDQETFDVYNTKRPFGITEEESNEKMLDDERSWLIDEIRVCLESRFDYQSDFVVAHRGGFRRSDTLVVYTLAAYEAFSEIASDVQRILCRCRNNWILYFQSLLDEGPDTSPDGFEDFIVWLYPDKIVATKENAGIVRRLLNEPRRKANIQRSLRRIARRIKNLVRKK
jgi:hypothetical protein